MDQRFLIDRLNANSVRRQSSSHLGGGRYFVDPVALSDILTENEVKRIVSGIPKIREDERGLFVSLIRESSLNILAILLYGGHEEHIPDFLYRRAHNSRLPFSRDGLNFLPPAVAAAFSERQWELIPFELKRGALHLELEFNHILPFLEDEKVASGGFGEVFKVKLYAKDRSFLEDSDQVDSPYIARKQLSRYSDTSEEKAVLEFLRQLRHPHIIELLGSYTYRNTLNLLFPFADMNLQEFFQSNKRLPPHVLCSGIYGLADALANVHNLNSTSVGFTSNRIGYHHDLRPANILLIKSVFIIADFGLSKLKSDDQTSKSILRGGHEDYLSPESFDEIEWENSRVGRAIDVWAFGCILTEFATYLEGCSVEEYKRQRKYTRVHDFLKVTDHSFHLNSTMKPAVDNWLSQLLNHESKLETDGLVHLAREILIPWRRRIEMTAIRTRIGTITLDSKIAAIKELFSRVTAENLETDQSSRICLLLENKRFSAWHQAYSSLETAVKIMNVRQDLETADSLLKSLELFTNLPEEPTSGKDESQVDRAIQEIWDFVDTFAAYLPKHQKQDMETIWFESVMNISDLDMKHLSSIALPKRYRMVGIKVSMQYLARAITKSIRLGGKSMLLDQGMVELSDFHETSLGDRSIGECNGNAVIVEWVRYDLRWTEALGDELLARIEALTKLLNSEQTPREGILAERILDCLGYIHSHKQSQFGLVYAAPGPPSPHQSNQWYSIHGIIESSGADAGNVLRPVLGDVFKLASGLAHTVAALHEIGWLHKDISSENLLVFCSILEEAYTRVASAVISGFSHSRPEENRRTLGPDTDRRFYKHPKYIEAGTEFKRTFDIFSVGIVLLEMGLWCTIRTLFRHRALEFPNSESSAEQNRRILLQKYVPQLGERMGQTYQDAVAFCLDAETKVGVLSEDPGARWKIRQAFQENVVDQLAKCFA